MTKATSETPVHVDHKALRVTKAQKVIRETLGLFHSGVYCHELDSTSQQDSLVNKNSLVNGGWVGVNSLRLALQKSLLRCSIKM